MTNTDTLFGIRSGAMSSPPMRVPYGGGSDNTTVYKSFPSESPPPPPPTYHHQMSTDRGGGGSEVPAAAAHGFNMNVAAVVGSDQQQQQEQHHKQQYEQQQEQPTMMMGMKKKRGRPRKYGGVGTDGIMPLSQSTTVEGGGAGAFSPPSREDGSSFKKARGGRPRGSTNKKKNNIIINDTSPNFMHLQHHHIQPPHIESAGFGFTPHIISVKAGEDVSSKIMSFSQNGPRAVCILSANGAISNVTLRQAETSGGTATYEGRFEILSLCGSFLLTEVGGQRSRTGGLSVSLAGTDGRVLGGCVYGLLTAASPVQVIVGSFIPDGGKESKAAPNHLTEEAAGHAPMMSTPIPMSMQQPLLFSGGRSLHAATTTTGVGGGGVSSSHCSSHGGESFTESSDGEGSNPPPGHSTGGTTSNHHHQHNNNNHPQGMLGMPWR